MINNKLVFAITMALVVTVASAATLQQQTVDATVSTSNSHGHRNVDATGETHTNSQGVFNQGGKDGSHFNSGMTCNTNNNKCSSIFNGKDRGDD